MKKSAAPLRSLASKALRPFSRCSFNVSDNYASFPLKLPLHDAWDRHMQFVAFQGKFPKVDTTAWIAPTATLVGDVTIYTDASVWYQTVIRGENAGVVLGAKSNIQDSCVILEADERVGPNHNGSTLIGHESVIGHSCVLKGATVEDEALVGMRSIMEPGSTLEFQSMLGAGSVLKAGQTVPMGELWLGNPARFVRKLTEKEKKAIRILAYKYVSTKEIHEEEFFLDGEAWIEAEQLGFGKYIGYHIYDNYPKKTPKKKRSD